MEALSEPPYYTGRIPLRLWRDADWRVQAQEDWSAYAMRQPGTRMAVVRRRVVEPLSLQKLGLVEPSKDDLITPEQGILEAKRA